MSTLTADTRKPTPVRYAYTSSTSSKGLDSVDAGTLQFAALTSAPTKKAMDAMPKLWAVPSVGGAVAIVFNVPGIAALKVSRENLAGVFLGKIRVWSELAKDNPSLANVTEKISLIVRSDSAGVSEVLTSALSSFSAEWKGSVGTSTRPKWPVSYKQYNESSDLAIGVRLAEYSLGYTSVENVDKFQLPVARISNAAGRFVLPTYDAVAAAMSAFAPAFADHVAGNTTIFFTPIVDPPVSAPDGYPIAAFVYVVFDTERLSCSTLFNVLYFVYWSWMDIDAAALAMFEKFVVLPKDVSEPLISKLLAIRCCSGSFVGTNVMDSLFPSVEGGGSQLP
jgi:ABC-type phosphate transport system substrate-binding protein